MPTEKSHDPVFREINLSAEARRIWGPELNAPQESYVFSNDRKFKLRTEDGYSVDNSSGDPRILEEDLSPADDDLRLLENGDIRVQE